MDLQWPLKWATTTSLEDRGKLAFFCSVPKSLAKKEKKGDFLRDVTGGGNCAGEFLFV